MAEVKLHGEQTGDLIDEGFATVNEAAQYLKMGRSWLYSQMDAGCLAYARFGRARRIRWADIKQLGRDAMVGASD
jgi:excisionase family DNA binding protein